MIVPAGNKRHQVNQGGFKHESMLDNSDIFAKFAQGAGGLVDDKSKAPGAGKEEPAPEVPDDLQETMNSGGLGMQQEDPMSQQQSQPSPQQQPAQPQQPLNTGGFESKANEIAMKVLEGLGLEPQSWNINTSVDQQAGYLAGINIKMTRGVAQKPVAKAAEVQRNKR